jgi:transposase-like protein
LLRWLAKSTRSSRRRKFFKLLDKAGTVRAAARSAGVNENAGYNWLRKTGLTMQRAAPRVYPAELKAEFLRLARERQIISTVAGMLREQITKLTAELALAETELTELAITRNTLHRLIGHAEATTPADTTIASPAYQQILTVLATAADGMRAKDICLALGTGVAAKDTEGMRAKLKRLVNRQVLAEAEPGLFTLAPTPTA